MGTNQINYSLYQIQDYFEFWDSFIGHWKNNQNEASWNTSKFPNTNSLNNVWNNGTKFAFPENILGDTNNTPTINFLPEPYWGFTPQNGKDLEIVVVNYNPWNGGNNQLFSNLTFQKYSDYVTKEVNGYVNNTPVNQLATSEWHWKKRGEILAFSKCLTKLTLENILSIELIPWHSNTYTALGKYPKANLVATIFYSLNMAISASKVIKNQYFKDKVILRISSSNFQPIAKVLGLVAIKPSNSGTFHSEQYIYQNVTLIIVWDSNGRNNLPSIPFLHSVI